MRPVNRAVGFAPVARPHQVVGGVAAAQQDGAGVHFERDVALELDGAGEVHAGREVDRAAARLGGDQDGARDGGGVLRHAVAGGAVLAHVIRGGGREKWHEGEPESHERYGTRIRGRRGQRPC